MSITHCWPRFSAHADCILHVLLVASPAVCCCPGMKEVEQLYMLTVDRCNDDYITVFHLSDRLWKAHSHALLMQTMQLCGLLNVRPQGTMTNQIANARKLNSKSDLSIKLQIFKLHLTTLPTWQVWPYVPVGTYNL